MNRRLFLKALLLAAAPVAAAKDLNWLDTRVEQFDKLCVNETQVDNDLLWLNYRDANSDLRIPLSIEEATTDNVDYVMKCGAFVARTSCLVSLGSFLNPVVLNKSNRTYWPLNATDVYVATYTLTVRPGLRQQIPYSITPQQAVEKMRTLKAHYERRNVVA
jgi:hypothetical protein